MSRHPNRPCSASVGSYESRFFPGRLQWQWICDGCGKIESGHATEAAALMAAANHEGVLAAVTGSGEEVDRLSAVRSAQAYADEGMGLDL